MIATEVVEKYLEMSHGRTRYLEAGNGYPTILLHGVGFTSGGDNFFLNLPALATRLHILAPTFVGWPLGGQLDLDFSYSYLADFVREFQDCLGIECSNIVAHSMGGWVASLLAYESPNRVNKLVLIGSGGTRTQTLPSMTGFTAPTRESTRKQWEERIKVPGVDLDALVDRIFERTRVPGALEAYQRVLNQMNNPVIRKQYNTLRRLPHIKAPTLVIWGRNDTTHPVEMGETTHQLIPGSQFIVVEDCGHFVPMERPDELNEALLDFLPD